MGSTRNYARNVRVVDNRFQGNAQTAAFTGAVDSCCVNLTFARNQSIGEQQGPVFVKHRNLIVDGNTITGGIYAGLALGGDGLRDATITDNTITARSGEFVNGIRLVNFGSEQNRDITIARNTITAHASDDGERGNAIGIGPQGAAGSVRIAHNRIAGNSGAGLRNEDDDVEIDAEANWWGCNYGPGEPGCDPVRSPDDGSNPDFSPWLTLSLSSIPRTVAAGASTTLTARLANLSSGPVDRGPFFAGAPVAFGATPAGTLAPPTAVLEADALTAKSVFTAGAASATARAAEPTGRAAQRAQELRATVDSQTVTINASDPPDPEVIPDIEVPDSTLRPGQKVAIIIRLTNRGNRIARRLRACLRLSEKLNVSGSHCRRLARLRPGQTVVLRVLARVKLNACRGQLAHRLRVTVAGEPPRVRRFAARLLAGVCQPQPCPTVARAGGRPAHAPTSTSALADRPRARAAC